MKKILVLSAVLFFGLSSSVRAQTAAPAAPPVMAPAPATAPAPVMAAPVVAPAMAVAAAPAPAAAPATPATPAPAAPEATPLWKSPAFWIAAVVGPVVGIIFTILLAFGVLPKKVIDFMRKNKIVEIADKVSSQFVTFAASTDNKVDDIIAMAVQAVVQRLGILTEDEQTLVKNVVADRIAQAQAQAATTTTKPEA